VSNKNDQSLFAPQFLLKLYLIFDSCECSDADKKEKCCKSYQPLGGGVMFFDTQTVY